MKRKNNNTKYINFRKEYDFFEYQSYEINVEDRKLNIKYNFNLSNKHYFNPRISFVIPDSFDISEIYKGKLNNLVFNIGMIELISYWKAACPKRIIIRPHKLNLDQVNWWKNLYFNGLGEFFYLNSITVNQDDFVDIESFGSSTECDNFNLDFKKVIVPVGGGKDSIVSLEVLKNAGVDVYPMMLNPNPARIRTINNADLKVDNNFVVNRRIDKQLLVLNDKGFLNGHTPFSALLGFTNVLLACLNGVGNIALSNENSANESTVPGTNINHQYSKSFEFENNFNYYIGKYINNKLKYFSFLRLLNEIQIAYLFSKFPWHFESFRSCNVGSKEDKWCGSCPKCLFTYLILSPFLDKKTLIKIFDKELLSDNDLIKTLHELSGVSEIKPFECVGTITEVRASIKNLLLHTEFKTENNILTSVKGLIGDNEISINELVAAFNDKHNVPERFLQILKNAIYD